MVKTLDEFIETLPSAEQSAIDNSFQALNADYMALQDLRKAMALTQEQVAAELQMDQSNLSKLEKRADLLISTLRRYIEAMGGSLHLVAQFPERPPVEVAGFGSERAQKELDADLR
jgi:transcriptional regulator with XRE-family HTH domain